MIVRTQIDMMLSAISADVILDVDPSLLNLDCAHTIDMMLSAISADVILDVELDSSSADYMYYIDTVVQLHIMHSTCSTFMGWVLASY